VVDAAEEVDVEIEVVVAVDAVRIVLPAKTKKLPRNLLKLRLLASK